MKIYCQGKILPEEEAAISANDHGFLYGAALFETFRTYGGKPFLLEEHVARLLVGCRAFAIVPGEDLLIGGAPAYPALRETIRELLAQNELADAVFRYTLSAGEMPRGLPTGSYENASEVLSIRPLPSDRNNVRIHILNTVRTEPEAIPRPKSVHYMNSLIAHRELRDRGAVAGDEGLMLTRDGLLSEGVVSNIFLVARNRLATPSASAHILAGITRNKVLDLAKELGVEAAEADLRLDDLTEADAIFTTNSVRGIVPVSEVLDRNETPIWRRDSAEHPVVKQLFAAYQRTPS